MHASEIEILKKTQDCLYLGALNKLLTPKEESILGAKIIPLILNPNAKTQTLTQKEFRALKPALVMNYMISHYPEIIRFITPQRSLPNTRYELNFLCLAELALKYGAANCDGTAAVTLYYLLQTDIGKNLNNIRICSIKGKHRFIMINYDQNNNSGIVIDAYYGFVKPLSEALMLWPEKGELIYQATIENIKDYVEQADVKKLLSKLEAAENARPEGTIELENIAKKFNLIAVKTISHISFAFWSVQKEIEALKHPVSQLTNN